VHRHLVTLRELGFVEKDDTTDGYRIGWKSYRLGTARSARTSACAGSPPRICCALHQDSGETVALAMPAGSDVAVIDAIQSTGHVAITIRPGSVIPAATSALGRAILAFQPEAARAEALRMPISRMTSQTPANRDATLARDVKRRWYEVAVNERLPGIAALAAPIFDDRNRVVASVGVIGSHAVVTQPPSPQLVAQVQEAAARVSAELHSRAWLDVDAAAHRMQEPREAG
jgi:IclR family KDG regulon transcriptional repressor